MFQPVKWSVALVVLCASIVTVQPVGAASTARKLPVVATFSILGDVAKQVGGDTIRVTTLVGPDGDAHTFEPSPQDSILIKQAQLIFEIGLHFETWLEKFYEVSESQAVRVVVSEGLSLLSAEHEDDHDVDPHIWHDVQNIIHITQRVRDALIQVAPAQADRYRANATQYIEALQGLDAWVVDQVQSLPASHRKLVTAHDTFGYFAKRYGFTVVGTALESFSTEAAEPSAGAVAALVNRITAEGVPAIFAENTHNSKLIQRIARETGVQLPPPLYTDALGPPGSAGATFIEMMRYNVTTIVNALQPQN
ncbi:metal ABC transporter solute-binding protein, Zn/Mn family [Candidatus Entotheonella palauensis]|uniref:metal ABC transporter solute-binding protein, Zn/Mn family n=1 Tax=Candidatus Entotheonella palauensis TaxID=93172 RepID=UPI000B7FBD97|nr:zinc ABC transporter substrate-binding protein [Candidatus Entotheonella palauensis]